MISNYLKIAVRNILRSKSLSAINVVGLSVGIAAFFLIFSYVYNEMNYDSFQRNASDIYRIYTVTKAPGNATERYFAVTPDPLPKALLNDYPGMFKVARLFFNEFWITSGNRSFKELVYCSDPSFFDVFSFNLLEGDRGSALNNPNSVVISKQFAQKIFASAEPMGQVLKINNTDFMVTGVLDDFPVNSSIMFDVLIPTKFRQKVDPGFEDKWYSMGTHTFISFTGKMTPDELRDQFPRIIAKYVPDFVKTGGFSLVLEPLESIHLHTGIEYDIVPPSSRTFLLVLMLIAISILLISCVNFTNISISRHTERIKEIGMRKVLGAQRSQVVVQFLCESILMSFVSLMIGIGLAEISLDQFRNLTGKEISISPFLTMPNILVIGAFGIFVGLIAGSYPALVLSKHMPAEVLEKHAAGRSKSTARNILVVGQFVIAAVLVTSVFLISQQVGFMKSYDMGFQPDNIVAVPVETEAEAGQYEKIKSFFNLISSNESTHGILSVAMSENIPGDHFNNTFGIVPVGANDKEAIQMVVSSMDENFVDTYRIRIIDGRNFSLAFATDKSDAVIINQSAARALGWTSAVGKKICYIHEHYPLTVIGVIKDINFQSLQNPMEPMVYRYAAGGYENTAVSLRLDPSRISEGLSFIRENWAKVFPMFPFDYFFVKDKYTAAYLPEEKMETIVEVFSGLAIFLAGLGLFGLSSLKVTQRTREIGVRKILGAGLSDILGLFAKEFLTLVLIANLIAVPVSYLVLNKWLQDFAYRTEISVWIFILSTVLALAIAFVTVASHAFRIFTVNPAEVIRRE